MTEFPKKKFADHDTTDEMIMLGYGYNLAIDDYERAIRDNLPSEEEVGEIIELYNGENCPIDGSKVSWIEYRNHFSAAISKLYNDRLNLREAV